MVKRKFLISYHFRDSKGSGTGRFFNNRPTDTMPSEEDILSMEEQIKDANDFDNVTIMNISEIAV